MSKVFVSGLRKVFGVLFFVLFVLLCRCCFRRKGNKRGGFRFRFRGSRSVGRSARVGVELHRLEEAIWGWIYLSSR